jgi:hypothetical protein
MAKPPQQLVVERRGRRVEQRPEIGVRGDSVRTDERGSVCEDGGVGRIAANRRKSSQLIERTVERNRGRPAGIVGLDR